VGQKQLAHIGLVIERVCQHLILAIEVKNSAKVTLLSFNRIAVFVYDVMVVENIVLEARWCSWCVCVGNIELRMQSYICCGDFS